MLLSRIELTAQSDSAVVAGREERRKEKQQVMEIGVLVSQLTLADIRQLLLPSTQAIYYSSVRLRKGELNDGRPACLPSFLPRSLQKGQV